MKSYSFKIFALLLIALICSIISFYDKIYNETYFQYKSFIYKTSINKKTPSDIKINLNHENYEIIHKKRIEALKRGYLIKEKGDYVAGKIIFNNKRIKTKIRLKGDHIDHLGNNMWSFRIKLKDTTILGYDKF